MTGTAFLLLIAGPWAVDYSLITGLIHIANSTRSHGDGWQSKRSLLNACTAPIDQKAAATAPRR